MQREGDWHAGGEVLGTSNPGDCPYDPGDCPGIEVVGSEAGRGRRPCARRRPPARPVRARFRGRPRASPGKRRVSVTPQSQSAPFSEAASSECAFPSRRGAREVWGNPPARLRGTMENASTGQMRSSNPPPGCGAGCAGVRRSRLGVWSHGKVHSAQPVGFRMRFSVRVRTQNAVFREGADSECGFP